MRSAERVVLPVLGKSSKQVEVKFQDLSFHEVSGKHLPALIVLLSI